MRLVESDGMVCCDGMRYDSIVPSDRDGMVKFDEIRNDSIVPFWKLHV